MEIEEYVDFRLDKVEGSLTGVIVAESDFFLAIVTFVACLVLPLEQGILVGIGINLIYILYHAARPKISVEKLVVSSY